MQVNKLLLMFYSVKITRKSDQKLFSAFSTVFLLLNSHRKLHWKVESRFWLYGKSKHSQASQSSEYLQKHIFRLKTLPKLQIFPPSISRSPAETPDNINMIFPSEFPKIDTEKRKSSLNPLRFHLKFRPIEYTYIVE